MTAAMAGRDPREWSIGQTVFVAMTDGRHSEKLVPRTVTKIGRKWITIKGGWQEARFDPTTMRVDNRGFGSTDAVWLSEAQYQAACDRNTAWSDLHRAIRNQWSPPEYVTTEQIRAFLAALGAKHE